MIRSRRVITGLLLLYTALLSYWMFFGRTTQSAYNYNLEPFLTIKRFLYSKDKINHLLINIFGNIAVFVPFGILLPLCLRKTFIRILIVFLAGVLCIETLQLVCRRGAFDVDDIILNTVGFLLGWLFYLLGRRFIPARITTL
jgi:glycopeptide antibiotics resistance protein